MFMTPSLLGVMLFVGIPFLEIGRRSVMDARGIQFKGIDNYVQVIQNTAFQRACVNTIRFMAICIPVMIVVSFILAFYVFIYVRKEKKNVVKMGYLLPYALPVASFVIVWKLLFDTNGMVNKVMLMGAEILKIESAKIDWMRTNYAFGILCLCYVWRQVGFYMVLWVAGMESMDVSIFEAAKLDGVTRCQLAKDIIFPNLKTTCRMILILALTGCFKCYREAYLVSGDYPHESMYMLQHVFNNWFASLDTQKMSAGAVMMVLLIAGSFSVNMRKKEE